MGGRLTRQQRRQQNRLSLLAAAEKVFAERGIQGASLDEVAAEAGLTKGAVYSNFASKEDLVLAVMRRRLGEAEQAQTERLPCCEGPAEQLVNDFGEFWAATLRSGDQELFARVAIEFMLYSLRHPVTRRQLVSLLFSPAQTERHPLAPPGSELAKLSPQHTDAILKALDVGMGLLVMLDPDHCPPGLFPIALRLLAGMTIDESRIPPARPAGVEHRSARDDLGSDGGTA